MTACAYSRITWSHFYIYSCISVFQALYVLPVEAVPQLVHLSLAVVSCICILCLPHAISPASAARSCVDSDLPRGLGGDASAHAIVGAALFHARSGGRNAEYAAG